MKEFSSVTMGTPTNPKGFQEDECYESDLQFSKEIMNSAELALQHSKIKHQVVYKQWLLDAFLHTKQFRGISQPH